MAAIITILYTLIVSFIILKIIKSAIGLRVEDQEELIGLDLESHGESGYNS
jgi:Amt family ammonium transporter